MGYKIECEYEYLFKNREEAYNKLFELIPKDIDFNKSWEIITTSINNIPQVKDIASKLNLQYEPFFIQEIYAPNNSECSIGAISESEDIVIHQRLCSSFSIDEDFVYKRAKELYSKSLQLQLLAFKNGSPISNIEDKNIMIFSDGCESGLNIMCTIKSLLKLKVKKIYLFVPFISDDLYQSLDMIVDKIFTNHSLKDFIDIEYYFEDFSDVDIEYLRYIFTNKSN